MEQASKQNFWTHRERKKTLPFLSNAVTVSNDACIGGMNQKNLRFKDKLLSPQDFISAIFIDNENAPYAHSIPFTSKDQVNIAFIFCLPATCRSK